jgi:hypothetical protein
VLIKLLFDLIEQVEQPRNSKEAIVISIVEMEGARESQLRFQLIYNVVLVCLHLKNPNL